MLRARNWTKFWDSSISPSSSQTVSLRPTWLMLSFSSQYTTLFLLIFLPIFFSSIRAMWVTKHVPFWSFIHSVIAQLDSSVTASDVFGRPSVHISAGIPNYLNPSRQIAWILLSYTPRPLPSISIAVLYSVSSEHPTLRIPKYRQRLMFFRTCIIV